MNNSLGLFVHSINFVCLYKSLFNVFPVWFIFSLLIQVCSLNYMNNSLGLFVHSINFLSLYKSLFNVCPMWFMFPLLIQVCSFKKLLALYEVCGLLYREILNSCMDTSYLSSCDRTTNDLNFNLSILFRYPSKT